MYALERTKLSSQKDFDLPIYEILISEAPIIRHRDGLPREEWGLADKRSAPRTATSLHSSNGALARLSHFSRPTR